MALIPVIADLISKYIKGEISVVEEVQLRQWIRESPHNREVFEELTNNKELLNQLSELHTAKTNSWATITTAMSKLESDKRYRTRRRRVFLAAVCVILLIGSLTYWFFLKSKTSVNSSITNSTSSLPDALPGHEGAILTLQDGKQMVLDSLRNGILTGVTGATVNKNDSSLLYSTAIIDPVYYHTLTTPLGRQYSLTLSDGTRLWLNAGSSVKFPTRFPDNERKIEITGEVYLEVAKDAAKPFRVLANNTKIEVVGTHFNVNAYMDEPAMTTSLLEGAILLKTQAQTKRLKSGEQVKIHEDSIRFVSNPDMEQAIAWKNGYFSFHSAGIKEIMRQLARWYDLEVIYKGEVPASRYEGSIDRSMSLMNVFKTLEIADIHIQVEGRRLIISP